MIIKPGTSLTTALKTIPDTWQVGSYNCSNAHAIPLVNNHPKFEGTTSDISLLRYISELRSRKYKVLLLLKVVVLHGDDLKLHCEDAKHINKFFEQQYQPFVAHYYKLSKSAIDAFVIASGLSQLTKIQDENDKFPAVTSLRTIASHAKTFLGNSVIITYAADYDEYHSYNGMYNMDELWLSSAIDVIGINAYFPLLTPGLSFDKLSIEEIAKLWETGEGYSYFYDKNDTDKKQPIAYTHPRSAWKNIQYWWENPHIEFTEKIEGNTGKLIDKKIWFIEYGFRSVENCTNRNTSLDFINDPTNNDPTNIDYLAQKVAIEGTLKAWKSSNMVERMFLYGWDLRPQRNTDVNSFRRWQSSFFVNRKIMFITLSSIIQDVL
ncbi:MAG: glycoside hydrolase TIM-barrel-like domain-containing protein, partial [Anaplasma sp.]|nr:glycoside hydrolase TIM-barrel-like domain-containing protein [Anaplasma sp.]